MLIPVIEIGNKVIEVGISELVGKFPGVDMVVVIDFHIMHRLTIVVV